jgi:hypothetical protein
MTEILQMQTTMRRTILTIIILAALCGGALADINLWSGDNPFAKVTGQRAVHALAISPDGSVIYCGLNSGTVMSLTFDSPPTVTQVVPPTGPVGGGTSVTITGTHFTGVLGVMFGDTIVDATDYTVVSSTEITVDAPLGTAGPVHVRVITPSGISAATTADVFTYTGPGARLYVVATSPQTAGTAFDLSVTALDALGSTATDYTGTVHFTSNDSFASPPSDYTFVPGDAGTHTFTLGATLNTAGVRTISANDTSYDTINGNTGPITVVPGAATHFMITAPTDVTAGTSFSITVTALDAEDNQATGYGGTVHFTGTDAAADLPDNSPLTNGIGSFSTTLNTAGTQRITATDTGTSTITGTSDLITVNPGPADRFTISATTPVTAGTPLTTLTVTALDADGNTNTTYTGTVHFTSSDAAATLPTDYTFTAMDLGVHGFSSEATLEKSGSQTITATDTVTTAISGASTITVVPAAVDHFTVTALPTASAGVPVTFSVTAADAFGNTVTGYSGTVQFSSSDAGAVFPVSSAPLTSGEGSFSATLNTAGPQTITATDTVTPSLSGTSGTILVHAATHFAVSAPVSATSGTAFTFSVTALDDINNPAAGYAGTVHFTSTDSNATLPGDATLAGGSGTFTATLRTLGTQTLTATDTGSLLMNGTSAGTAVSDIPATSPTGSGISSSDSSDNTDDFPSSGFPLMTVTVNIGGDSKAWQAIVTGTKLSELIVTGTVQPGSGNNLTAPPGTVYQFISLVPARYTSITKAVINFTVPQAWLDENHIAPGSIVLYHQTANGWEALPTTVLYTKDGTVYFSAQSTGFSLFAITGITGSVGSSAVSAPVATTGSFTGGQEPVRTAEVTKAPVKTQTTVSPPAPAAPSSGFPLMTVVLIGAGFIVLIGSGWYVRRWWIQRQNPALFREYD